MQRQIKSLKDYLIDIADEIDELIDNLEGKLEEIRNDYYDDEEEDEEYIEDEDMVELRRITESLNRIK